MPHPAVVCIGHVTLDAITRVDRRPPADGRVVARDGQLASGGPAATAAVTLARLGVAVSFIGTVGEDDAGRLAMLELEREGVDTSRIRISEEPTAISTILVDEAGQRSIAAFNGGSGVPELSAVDVAMLESASWIHVDHIGAAALPRIRGEGIRTPISVDAGNPIPGLDLAAVDLYAPTETALLERYAGSELEEAIRSVLGEGPEVVVVTRGAGGSIAGTRLAGASRPSIIEAAGFAVDVVSSLGAGDVFHGALLAGLCDGLELARAMWFANAAAALSCRALDGRSAIAGRAETLALAGLPPRDVPVAAARGRRLMKSAP